jgi:5'-3' exonuclease
VTARTVARRCVISSVPALAVFPCHTLLPQAVITEDSDLLPFGAPRVLFKMGKDGRGQEVQLRHLPACEELSFLHWTDDM